MTFAALTSFLYRLISRLFPGNPLQDERRIRVVMVGLDNAGKTIILFKLALGEVVRAMRTIGFNVQSIRHANFRFDIWEIGGYETRLRSMWSHYFTGMQAIIFVVDSSDSERFLLAQEELYRCLSSKDLRGSPLLVLANKQDLPGALSPSEITYRLGLHGLSWNKWHIQPTCGLTGDGLHNGLDWLAQNFQGQLETE